LSTLRIGTPPVEEKRPTFAFLRRIRDHRKFGLSALGDSSEADRYTAVLTNAGDSVVALVSEWADQWLEGTRGDADVEKRLEGMVEEVVWGNVIWYGVGGWQARGDVDRPFNADFFVCVRLSFEPYFVLIPRQRSSRHLRSLLAHARPSF
jgi:hypothetical protein